MSISKRVKIFFFLNYKCLKVANMHKHLVKFSNIYDTFYDYSFLNYDKMNQFFIVRNKI